MTLKTKDLFISVLVILISFLVHSAESSGQARKARSEGFDPNEPPETKYQILPYLTFGSQIEFEYKYYRNLDLDNSSNEDESTIEPAINLAFSFDPFTYLQAFVNVKFGGEFEIEDGKSKKDRAIFEIEEAYLFFKDLFQDRFSLQIGRQQFDDERQWLYDAELDGARAFILHWGIVTQLSFSRDGIINKDLINKEAGDETNNYTIYSTYFFNEDTNIAAYFLARDDTTGENDSPIFLGMHSDGEISDNFDYWIELAYATGKEGSNSINGYGFDLGLLYAFDTSPEPSITLGYAFGSREFRQTGLEGNEGDFNGVVDFLYYGEFLEPELSNMSIVTVGTGLNPTDESSIDLVYHYYFQTKALDELRDSNLDIEPNGINKSLGNEIDLVLGYEQKEEKVAIALSFGYFFPGGAFPSDAANGFSAKLVMAYEF
jgi:alginate production protein